MTGGATGRPSGIAAVNGTRLYYETRGAGPPVVFVHGFSLDTRMWDPQFELFAQQFRAVRYDARGFGQSALPDSAPYTHAADLLALIQHLELEPAHLVGLSFGGGLAIEFAMDHPASVRSLTVVDGALGGYAFAKDWGAVGALARGQGLAAAKQAWLADELFAAANDQPGIAAQLRAMVEDYSGYHWLHKDPGRWSDTPGVQRLEALAAPTLAIVGERDLPDFHAIADLVAARAPDARKVVLKGVGHMSNMEAPLQFNEIVAAFLLSHS